MAFISPFENAHVCGKAVHQQGRYRVAANTPFRRPSPAYQEIRKCSYSSLVTERPAAVVDALDAKDLIDGSLLAFALALVFSYLQERRRDQPDRLESTAGEAIPAENSTTTTTSKQEQDKVFDSWKEMSREENYVYYNNRVKRQSPGSNLKNVPSTKREQKWVLVALLVLFVPIFSAEFFLALSRQVLCGGDPLTQSSWAAELCSPHL